MIDKVSGDSHPSAPQDPALAAAREARRAQSRRLSGEGASPAWTPTAVVKDPLPYCVWTTVALIAWLVTPALAVTFFAVLGVVAYARAWRTGLRRTDCLLREPRIAILYLALAAVAGAAVSGWRLWVWWVG